MCLASPLCAHPYPNPTRTPTNNPDNFIALGLVGAGIACYYAFFQDVDVETRKLQAAVNANAKAAADEVAKAAKSAAAEKVVAAEKAANNVS
jgi:uncharacterized protein YdbL (DUF1318 family)